jgi:outer membrane protein TolC
LGQAVGLALVLGWSGAHAGGQETLTLRQAIDRALGENPEATMARADEKDAGAAAGLARTGLLPQLNFTEDISRGNDPVYAFGDRLRQRQFTVADFALYALNLPQPIGNFSSRISGSWLAFDSFKTEKEIRRADLFRKSSASSAQAADQKIVLDVAETYQQVLYAERGVEVARHEQETADALLQSVDERVKAGLAVESDRMASAVNAAARREESIAAEGALELAWAELRTAMGAEDMQSAELKPLAPHVFAENSLEQEVAQAAKMRPDLMALGDAQEAQAQAVSAARADFGPRVSAYGNLEEDRGSLTSAGGHNWVAGVQINVDILPLGKRDQLARASATKERMDAQRRLADEQIRLQVSRAHIARRTAALQVETARAAMDQAAESLRIVKNRYDAGLATITELLRAEDAERESQTNYWHAVYGHAMAYAELLYATGTLTPDAAEELQ